MPRFVLDSGNFSDNPSPQGKINTKAVLDGMDRMGYDAVNVGERDVQQGYPAFLELVGSRSFPFVSANIVRSDTKAPVFPPSVVVEADAVGTGPRMRIGVIGAARFNPTFRKPGPDGSDLIVISPREVVAREIGKLHDGKVNLIVLLAALPREDARRLAQEVPGIDFVVGSYGGDYTMSKERQGDTWILYSGNQGKRLGETRAYLRDGTIEQDTKLHTLTDAYPSDEAMLEFVNSIPRSEAAPLPVVGASPAPQASASPYVGSAVCQGCHGREGADWAASAHAAAWKTLEAKHAAGNADCTACHVTGHGTAGGFASAEATPQLAGVGCESCHGPGRDHVARSRQPYGDVTVATCTVCHDRANSPKFDAFAYLPRINHRAPAAK